jgi:DNA polymerase III alpha subunit
LEALGQPKDIVKRAKELLYPAIAITDYNGMF